MAHPLPAHQTKHLSLLQYPFKNSRFHLTQLDNGITNGTALWLGAQCLSSYLADLYSIKSATDKHAGKRPRVIELGSGIGLSALALSALGWDVLATDLPDVISSVLSDNITCNSLNLPLGSGSIQVKVLDWTIPPDKWTWDNDVHVASDGKVVCSVEENSHLVPPFDLIISADTLYSPLLAQPLLRTIHELSKLSQERSLSKHPPPVYLCIERRDPSLIDKTLSSARDEWNFAVDRIPHRKLARAMEKNGLKWEKDDWEGVEIWKLVLQVPMQRI